MSVCVCVAAPLPFQKADEPSAQSLLRCCAAVHDAHSLQPQGLTLSHCFP